MYLLFDIGGTKTRVAVSRDHKRIGSVRIVPTPKKFKTGIRILKFIAGELARGKKITAVAGGLAGSFDRAKDKIVAGGANIRGWVGRSVRREFERVFGVPVYLENDAALAGLAEAVKGAGRGKEIVVYYTVSTGFGGARIVNGKIDANARGFEPEYQVIEARKLLKNYRQGRVGEYVTGKGIEMRLGKKPEQISDFKTRDELAKWLAVAIHNGILHWSPDIIVVGGSVMNIIPAERVRFFVKKIYKGYFAPPPVIKAKLGDSGGLRGALVYLNQKLGNRS